VLRSDAAVSNQNKSGRFANEKWEIQYNEIQYAQDSFAIAIVISIFFNIRFIKKLGHGSFGGV
jgi:hypothetical protein